MFLSPAIGVMGGAQVIMVGEQQEEVVNSQVRKANVVKIEILL